MVKSTTYVAEAAGNIFRIATPGKGASNVSGYSFGRQGGLTPQGKQANARPPTKASTAMSRTLPTITERSTSSVPSSTLSTSWSCLAPTDQTDIERKNLWGAASALGAPNAAPSCSSIRRRTGRRSPAAEAGVAALKIGVETRNAAIYWPRVRIPPTAATGQDGRSVRLDRRALGPHRRRASASGRRRPDSRPRSAASSASRGTMSDARTESSTPRRSTPSGCSRRARSLGRPDDGRLRTTPATSTTSTSPSAGPCCSSRRASTAA